MYEKFEIDLEDVLFEWDDTKEVLNFQKHGIHFKTAAKVFLDPDKLIGKVGKILFVVCAFRDNNVIRLISARLATKPERDRYEYDEDEY